MTTVDSPHALGRAVRDAREAAGLTQQRLAEKAGVGRQWLVGLELGDKESAPLDMILRVLGALDLSVTLTAPPPLPPADIPDISLDEILAAHRRPMA